MKHAGLIFRAVGCGVLAWTIVSSAQALRGAENPGKRKSAPPPNKQGADVAAKPPLPNPIVQLVVDPAVQAELSLAARQTSAIDEAYAKIEGQLWLLRDAVGGPAAEQRASLTAALENDLESILDPPQKARLRQLVLQARGWASLTTAEISGPLGISSEQVRRIESIVEETQAAIQEAASSAKAPARDEAIGQLRKREGASIQKLLSAAQRQRLAELVGKKFDLSRVRPLTFRAPELKTVDAWIGSPPLKLGDLRGKVVAFHFWAFGCINCVHNLPHYTAWHERFSERGLVVVGLHTPETQAERVLSSLEEKVKEYAIAYPVAVDHENQNWAAWSNSMWPSVYLVDKRGRVRYWWYGEMNWQGTQGEKFMRQKIEELLAEND
jgi:thiol-disulfide isomerase/thioredoxin